MKILIAAFLAIFMCFGCCQNVKFPSISNYHRAENRAQRSLIREVLIDKDFTVEQKSQIEAAIEQWNFTLNGYIVLKVVDDNAKFDENFIPQHNQLVFIQMVNTDPDSGTLAYTNDAPGNLIVGYVNNLKRVDDPIIVYEHEIGHALGANHNEHKGSLLYPYYVDQATCNHSIDQYTLEGVQSVEYFINLKNTNYCIIK